MATKGNMTGKEKEENELICIMWLQTTFVIQYVHLFSALSKMKTSSRFLAKWKQSKSNHASVIFGYTMCCMYYFCIVDFHFNQRASLELNIINKHIVFGGILSFHLPNTLHKILDETMQIKSVVRIFQQSMQKLKQMCYSCRKILMFKIKKLNVPFFIFISLFANFWFPEKCVYFKTRIRSSLYSSHCLYCHHHCLFLKLPIFL